MKNRELAELLGVESIQITEKLRSTNKLTATMTKLLLQFDHGDVAGKMDVVNKWWSDVESDRIERKKQASTRAKGIKK